MTPENAEILALEALGWLAGEEDAISRFLAQSGLEAGELRAAAGTAEMNAAVLDFLAGDEALLLRFCEEQGVKPEAVQRARRTFTPEGLREI